MSKLDFNLPNVDGQQVSLAGYPDAKGFIIVFTCNHCPHANFYEQRIMDLDVKYASLGFPVIAICPNDAVAFPDDSFDNMKRRSEQKGYTFPYLYDESQEVARNYNAKRTPHVYVLKKSNGGVEEVYNGAVDDNSSYHQPKDITRKYVEEIIDAAIEGRDYQAENNEPIGCTIKWKV